MGGSCLYFDPIRVVHDDDKVGSLQGRFDLVVTHRQQPTRVSPNLVEKEDEDGEESRREDRLPGGPAMKASAPTASAARPANPTKSAPAMLSV
eukprot:675204-Hanusia_phi.AAC.18